MTRPRDPGNKPTTRGRMFRAWAHQAPKLEGMYVPGVSGPARDTPEAADDGAPSGAGRAGLFKGAGLVRGSGLAEVGERVRAARALFDRPLTSYYLIAGITALLLCLGLVMVLSTASVADLQQGESPYHDFEA